MHPNPAPIAVLGLAVCTGEYPDLIAFRHDLAGVPADRPAGPALTGVSDLLHAVLRDGGVEPNDPRCSQLGVFITGKASAVGIGALATEGIRAALTEYTGEHGALHAVARASEALCAGDCQLAVVLALDPSAASESRFEGSGALLGQAGTPAARAYAHLYPGLARKTGDAGPASLLAEAAVRAEVDIKSLGLLDVQGHGDGTQTLAALLGQLRPELSRGDKHLPHCTVGPLLPSPSAVDALNGFCAVALALYERILPPLRGDCRDSIARPFTADPSPRPWIGQTPRRAGMLALHPGADAALILEQPPGDPHAEPPRMDSAWPVELILLSTSGRAELTGRMRSLAERAAADKGRPLRELARDYASAALLDCRAAVVARDTGELADKLGRFIKRLETSASTHFQTPDGTYFAEGKPKDGKTALMIPGQGSQYLGMFGDLCLAFPGMQAWFERVHDVFGDTEICPPQFVVAQPGIGFSDADRLVQHKRLYAIGSGATVMLCGCLGLYGLLAKAGVKADMLVGYSNGENAALIASDTWRFSGQSHFFAMVTDLRENDVFERSGIDIPRGASAAVNNVPRTQLGGILDPYAGRVFLALDNCPDQVVLFGEADALAEVTAQLTKAGAFCSELPFDRGHHTPFYQPHADMLLTLYGKFDFGPGQVPLYSCITSAPFPEEPDEIRALAASQWTRCVRFGDTVQRLYDDGVRHFVEVGPGSRLSGFVHNTLRGHPHAAISVNVQGRPGLEQLLKSLGHLFAIGQPIDLGPLTTGFNAAPLAGQMPANPQPPGNGGATRHILAEHFLLMQDFLEGQRRSHRQLSDILGVQGAAPPPPRTAWPMLGGKVETGEGWLKARRTFTLGGDPFLAHHAFGLRRSDAVEELRGLPVIPFTFSMELVAEAAARLAGWSAPGLTLSGLNAVRWLAADDALTVDIEAHFAESPDTREKAVRVRIFEVTDPGEGLRALAFEGWAHPAAQAGGTPLKAIQNAPAPQVSATQLNARLFHGPLLKSICGIAAIDAGGAELNAVVPPVAGLFQGQDDPALRIPAALLDAVGQLVFYWLAGQGCQTVGLFPFQVARYVQFAPPPPPGSALLLRGQARLSANITHADVEILDAQGAILARVEGLKMKLYDYDDPYLRYVLGTDPGIRLSERIGSEWHRRLQPPPGWFSAEAQGIWGRLLARVALNGRERRALREVAAGERVNWTLTRVVAKELALDWLETLGVHAQPADIEAVGTGTGFLFQGEALGQLSVKLRVRTETTETGIMAALTGDG
ncbi:MAG: polyketide synthase dehydratase domain-containing protein [Proteobacteria bacterium]|nr:polyketide synthase dehydratase domain-containing protein [Pseudomonadota bacterium]